MGNLPTIGAATQYPPVFMATTYITKLRPLHGKISDPQSFMQPCKFNQGYHAGVPSQTRSATLRINIKLKGLQTHSQVET